MIGIAPRPRSYFDKGICADMRSDCGMAKSSDPERSIHVS